MTEIERYKNAIADKKELLLNKIEKRETLSKEITELQVDLLRMQKKLNGR